MRSVCAHAEGVRACGVCARMRRVCAHAECGRRRQCVWEQSSERTMWASGLAVAALLALAAPALAQDFEFDDDAPEDGERRVHRYVYDPHSPLCRALACKKRETCLLRDAGAGAALCANKKDILRKGDVIVAAGAAEEDDVFYEGAERCVGCASGGGGFLCGSDNRTYSSACRLRLHNCVRRPAPAVRAACRGFCPCRAAPAAPAPACSAARMADRLLDWFGVLQAAARGAAPPARGFPPACKPEVRWMFAHLDADGSGRLSAAELYALRHDERERCLRPFLAACGAGGGGGASRAAWCGCLRRAARPCAALARAARRAGGGWAPACDARGLYRPRQCHAALAVCWCVDAHGQELAGSRTKGEPRCPPHRAPLPAPAAAPPDTDDEDAAGSGDAELRY